MKENRIRRVLVVDDDKNNCDLIQEALERESYQVKVAYSGDQALQLLQRDTYHLMLLDQDMPGLTGLETLTEVRRQKYDIDVVFVSANLSPNMVSQALESGADDYVRKPFSFKELISRLKVRFRLRDLKEDLQSANARLFELSQRDDLTGLYNMRHMYEKIDQELKKCKRTGRHVTCVMMDMDYFKSVNDGHDHLFGSFVLKEVGRLLRENIRDIDLPARYGGDEFLVVLTDTDEAGTKVFTDRICQVIRSHSFTEGSDTIKLTVSLGYAVSPKTHEATARDLVRIADHALYEAKESGRNRAVGLNPTDVLDYLVKQKNRRQAA